MIEGVKCKSALIFLAITLLALSFPVQVMLGSPFPSLFPYTILCFLFLVDFYRHGAPGSVVVWKKSETRARPLIAFYSFFVLYHSVQQCILGFITISELSTSVVIFILPVAFFLYFNLEYNQKYVRTVLYALSFSGLVVGLYFAYDSYAKLQLLKVNDYAFKAFYYSLSRSGQDEALANTARIGLASRSMGLLESHTVSGAWVVIGVMATLTWLDRGAKWLRTLTIALFGSLLLLGLNFTNIIAFFLLLYFLEFGGYAMLQNRSWTFIKKQLLLATLAIGSVFVAGALLGDRFLKYTKEVFEFQKALLDGSNETITFVRLISDAFGSWMSSVKVYPALAVMGDGFSNFGMLKGGDFGLIESMARFGVVFFFVLIASFIIMVFSSLRYSLRLDALASTGEDLYRARLLRFCICLTLLVFLNEMHYSVWAAKSILPVIFIVLAIYNRTLSKTVPSLVAPSKHY